MYFQSQLLASLILAIFLVLWTPAAAQDEASLSTLYNSLLQREYAEPVVFPNHQVERKAQRSPSLRLRFGRRSDPELVPHTAEKRWFDEVNQKPIRSPSLRLRFGRRSDPSMPMHSPLDILMNQAYENQLQHDLYEENMNEENEAALDNNEEDLYDTLMQAQKLRNLMLLLNKYGNKDNEEMAARSSLVAPLDRDVDEYERAIRKPGGPLRLRWGRSTGGASSMPDMALKDKNVLELKNKVAEISNEVDKSINTQNKD